MTCKICETETVRIFETEVLNKYSAAYFQCPSCQFVQTEEPYWLPEAYKNAITSLDIGLIDRNIYLADLVEATIASFFDPGKDFLDYGGGYGILVRLMRDRGYKFYREDKFCENLFARFFDLTDLPGDNKFECVTAFELFEHLPNPLPEISGMLYHGSSLLFSTELVSPTKSLKHWEYLIPETGQHVSLYSLKSLQVIAEKFDLRLYSNGSNVHLLTRKDISGRWFSFLTRRKIAKLHNIFSRRRESLLLKDYQKIKEFINKNPSNQSGH